MLIINMRPPRLTRASCRQLVAEERLWRQTVDRLIEADS